MTDIIERLRHWSHGLTYDPAAGLMHEAAAEIERLRLTDEEREAVEHGLEQLEPYIDTESRHSSATLRKLLDRLA